ncbi:KH domain-containing protein [Candidatus Saccharibacteria bacterium]|nr:KH domain-containing protein [Candidatus Saccharibacteria bacterium]
MDQQFIEYIVKSLVGNPDAVKIERTIDEKGVLLELTVDPEDIGRVIGKRGSTAQSLRALLRALGTKNDARYNLKIVDVDRPEGERGTSRKSTPPTDTQDDATDDSTDDATDDSADEDNSSTSSDDSDLAKKTRAELADLDDLDI